MQAQMSTNADTDFGRNTAQIRRMHPVSDNNGFHTCRAFAASGHCPIPTSEIVAHPTDRTGRNRLILLAPRATHQSGPLVAATSASAGSWGHRLAEIQRIRATVCLKDGNISSTSVTPDGRFVSALDESSWHLGLLSPTGEVLGCMRFTIYPKEAGFDDLPFRDHPLATSNRWSALFRSAVESVMDRARSRGRALAQAGMWALAEEARTGSNALRLVMATFALAQLLGDGYAICTATLKHHSAMILQRLGATPLRYLSDELPEYYEPHYNSQMRLLFFDSRQHDPRFVGLVAKIQAEFRQGSVLVPHQS